MDIHFIAIGGAVMHNLAIALHEKGHRITGSDDEIYEPSRSRLKEKGLYPAATGWDAGRIHPGLDLVILGMNARKNNPELKKAAELGLKIQSFPEYLYEHSKRKKRVVIGGSHGKTTITAMVMHVLRDQGMDFDYMVGSQVEGFDSMVKLTDDAPYIILEGDEYLSSTIDPRPKFHLYNPHMVLLSGIAWDHMNVFRTFGTYKQQFRRFLRIATGGGKVFYYEGDPVLEEVVDSSHWSLLKIPYGEHPFAVESGRFVLKTKYGSVPLCLIGRHNMQNIQGALLICRDLGVEDHQFYGSIQTFKGADRMQQLLANGSDRRVYLDFAHAPSKVKATINAFRETYPNIRLVTCLELHTYSSLNREYIPQYHGAMEESDRAIVYYNPANAKKKRLPPLSPEEVRKYFGMKDLEVYNDAEQLVAALKCIGAGTCILLLMTSGDFSGMDVRALAREWAEAGA